MTLNFDFKWIVTAVITLLFASILWLPLPQAQAQGTPKPTPTNVPTNQDDNDDGDSDNDDDDDGDRGGSSPLTILPGVDSLSAGADVSGTVVDLTTGQPQPNVRVTLAGRDVTAEAVTDFLGSFRFGGLGTGQGVLNIDAPPRGTSVSVDVPVTFQQAQEVNLGYYTGNVNPLPVRLTSRRQGDTLLVTVENRSPNPATNALVDVALASNLAALPDIQTTSGRLTYSPNRLQLAVGFIPSGGRVETVIPLLEGQAQAQAVQPARQRYAPLLRSGSRPAVTYVNQPDPNDSDLTTQVTLTYDQQPLRQTVVVDGNGNRTGQSVGAAGVNPNVQIFEQTTTLDAGTTVNPTATSLPVILPTATPPPTLIPTTAPTITPTATRRPIAGVAAVDRSSSPPVVEPAAAFIPSAGGQLPPQNHLTQLFIAIGLCLTLLVAGWVAMRADAQS